MANFSEPRENIMQLSIREGMTAADFGAGSGHYTRALAALVGKEGKVYAIDIQEDVLRTLIFNTKEEYHKIIETVWGDFGTLGGSHLRDHVIDAGVLTNVLFQVPDKKALMTELLRVLKPGGKLLVVDWAGSYKGMGPSADQVIPEHDAEALFIGAGFHKLKEFRGGPHHYGFVFETPTV